MRARCGFQTIQDVTWVQAVRLVSKMLAPHLCLHAVAMAEHGLWCQLVLFFWWDWFDFDASNNKKKNPFFLSWYHPLAGLSFFKTIFEEWIMIAKFWSPEWCCSAHRNHRLMDADSSPCLLTHCFIISSWWNPPFSCMCMGVYLHVYLCTCVCQNYRWLWTNIWVLEIKPRSLGRATSAFNYWATPLAPNIHS